MALHHDADAYRQVKDAWKDATEARQIIMLDDLRDLLDGIGFADDDEYGCVRFGWPHLRQESQV